MFCSGYHVITFGHNENDVDCAIAVYKEIFLRITKTLKENSPDTLLEGKMVMSVFCKL